MTNTAPNWDSINQSLISIINSVGDFVEEHAPRLSGEANCAQSVPQEAEVGEVQLDPTAEAVRLLKLAEKALEDGEVNKSNALINLADRYQMLR